MPAILKTAAFGALVSATAILHASGARAEPDSSTTAPAVVIGLSYTGDVVGVANGGTARGVRYLDNLDVTADVDLERAIGWQGAAAHVDVLNNLGGRPNDLAGSIQGVDNIEVTQQRIRLYEAWLEQSFGAVSLRAGLYDINSEFYSNESAGLLIASPFGMGSELSATGPNGPSTFPSTALAARLKATVSKGYAQFAVVNANAGTLGDDQGIDLSGRDGALLLGEVGWSGRGKFSIGGWLYTKKQPEIIPPGLTIGPDTHSSHGAYVIAEHDVAGTSGDARHVRGFARLGISEGKTTPFRGGWQAGLLMDRVFASRPSSAVSIGAAQGSLSGNYRQANPVDMLPLRPSETIVEATYSDELVAGLTVQPDVQYVIHPSADRTIRNALVLGMRLQLNWSSHP